MVKREVELSFALRHILKHNKRYYVGGYSQSSRQIHIVHLKGPYSWAFAFYRPYHNQTLVFTKLVADEEVAERELSRIFAQLLSNPKINLERMLKEGWEKIKTRDNSKNDFYSMLKQFGF